MEPLFFVMAIMGCGDGNVQCTQARVVPVRYETMAQCRAALPYQLAQNTDVDYPMVGAACQRHGAEYVKTAEKRSRS